MVLDKIDNPEDIKKLTIKEKKELANEIRKIIIKEVLDKGGHLSSNLGVVELTIALYSQIDLEKDKVVWDVGHQTYTHKILTGRKNLFSTLRQKDGISGFPKREESKYDAFDTGHSSTSISAALGMARARDILKEDNKIYAVIGDGAITSGIALEALNDAGISDTDITIILNDNQMSISKNTGGFSKFLSDLRTRKFYIKSNHIVKKIVNKIPLGEKIINLVEWIKKRIKGLIIKNMFFENIGFTYLGPVDGHNIDALEDIIKKSKNIKGPKLLHVITKKGKGYKPAELTPDKYHMYSPSKEKKTYSSVMAETITKLAEKDKKIVAITAAMEYGTGLFTFKEKFPDRFFDVEIAEEHALTMAAGMAAGGLKPVVAIYSSFLQRGFDQIIHDICMQNLPVVICVDRAGIVGQDGETHQGILDLSFLNIIPNLTIMSPKNKQELEEMLKFSFKLNKPIAIRYPKTSKEIKSKTTKIEYGKAEIIEKGKDITIVAMGKMVNKALEVRKMLLNENIKATVINARFLKPLDVKTIKKEIKKSKLLVTIEDNIKDTGFGEKIRSEIDNIKIITLGYPDKYISHGKIEEIENEYNLSSEKIYKQILREYKKIN